MMMNRNGIALGLFACSLLTPTVFIAGGCTGPTKAGQEARAEMKERYAGNRAALAAQQAEQNYEVGNLDDALQASEAAISLQPEVAAHYVMRGRIVFELQKLDIARRSFERAIELDPNHADAHYFLGLVFQRWSDNENALTHYRAAYDLDAMNPDYTLATLETLISMRRYSDAEAFLSETISYFEHNAAMRRAQGHLYLMQGQPSRAAEAFNKSMLLNPDDLSVVEDLAYALFKANDFARAEYHVDRLLKDPERADRLDLRRLKARCLVAQERFIDARFIYLELTQQFSSERSVWYELGMVALELGDLKRVQQVSARMVSTWPTRHEGYFLRAMFAIEREQMDVARNDLLQALSLAPQDEETRLMLSMALIRVGLDDVARSTLARSLELNPSSDRARRLLATLSTDVASAPVSP